MGHKITFCLLIHRETCPSPSKTFGPNHQTTAMRQQEINRINTRLSTTHDHCISSRLITPLSNFLAKFLNNHILHNIPKACLVLLSWWSSILSFPHPSQTLQILQEI